MAMTGDIVKSYRKTYKGRLIPAASNRWDIMLFLNYDMRNFIVEVEHKWHKL
jgi:hypothetical protein